MEAEVQKKYADMLNLSHPVSRKHPPMSIADRAAQFAPFAALTGHGAAIRETARLTDTKIELDESLQSVLDKQLQELRKHVKKMPEVSFTYFLPDVQKNGGMYVTVTGKVKKIDEYENEIVLEDGTRIQIDDVLAIEQKV
ncbi:MAG: YolD-like family protein [Lachnospiraceae bacterium]|nr:YolD-like family protein [Lachnospiraceae bacterium]